MPLAEGALVGIKFVVSLTVPLSLLTVSFTNELSVTPSLGKTIGVPDVIDIDPSVDDVELVEMVSFLLLSIGI